MSISTGIGVVQIGAMRGRGHRPVANYTALMETLFDFIGHPRHCSRRAFACSFDAMSAVTGPYALRDFRGRLGAPKGRVINGVPLARFRRPPSRSQSRSCQASLDLAMTRDAPDFGAASDGDGDRNLIIGAAISSRPPTAWPCSPPTPILRRAMPRGSRASRARCRPAAPPIASRKSCGVGDYETPTGWKFFGNLLDAGLRHDLRRGERRHRLQSRAREGRAVGGTALARYPRRAQAERRPSSCANIGRHMAGIITRATITKRSISTSPTR